MNPCIGQALRYFIKFPVTNLLLKRIYIHHGNSKRTFPCTGLNVTAGLPVRKGGAVS